jgi:hypothetical protein
LLLQLPGRNRPRAKNSSGHCSQKRVFDCLAHDSFLLFSKTPHAGLACCYFLEGATPASLFVQNAVSGVVKEQTQLEVAQGLVRLHVPPQVVPWTSVRNCRAETVPTHRTAIAMTANNRFCIFFMA